jgi:hypothetical protein
MRAVEIVDNNRAADVVHVDDGEPFIEGGELSSSVRWRVGLEGVGVALGS